MPLVQSKIFSKHFVRTALDEFCKPDLVYIAQRRGSTQLSSALHAMTKVELISHIANLSQNQDPQIANFASSIEEADVKFRSKEREKIVGAISNDELAHMLSILGHPSSGSRDKNAQLLIDIGGLDAIKKAKERSIITPDKDQLNAINAALEIGKHIFIAGPGAGKTTTVAHLALKMMEIQSSSRIIILAFNRAAKCVMNDRIRELCATKRQKAQIIAKQAATSDKQNGILILTFDEFIYHFRTKPAGLAIASSYAQAFQNGLVLPQHVNECADLLILDEAQDVNPSHATLINQLIPKCKRIVAAGDPRQELYPGAVWFSRLTNNSDWKKYILATNHRSSPGIITALNIISRKFFPTLHHDQKSPTFNENIDFSDSIHWQIVEKGCVGVSVADALLTHQAHETVALAPVSIEKWNIGKTVTMIQQIIYESGNENPVFAMGDGMVLSDFAYFLGTARTAKGTERDHVVLFSSEVDYTDSGPLSVESFYKLLFVCLSRARKTCTIVLNGPPPADFVLLPLAPPSMQKIAPREIPPILMNITITATDAAKLGYWQHGEMMRYLDNAISNVKQIELPVIEFQNDERYGNRIDDIVPDADVVGMAVEAALAHHLGFDLANIQSIRPAELNSDRQLSEFVGLIALPTGGFSLVYDPRKIHKNEQQKFVQQLFDLISEEKEKNAAYLSVVLQRSAEIGSVWTVSKRLMNEKLLNDTLCWSNYININSKIEYQKSGCLKIYCHRSDREVGSITYRTDFEKENLIIEIKHTNEMKKEHLAQACIYACARDFPQATVINTKIGKTVTFAPCISDFILRTRAYFALRVASNVSNRLRSKARTWRIPEFYKNPGRNFIAVDIETNGIGGLITEIGAVCFRFSEQDWMVDSFHSISKGCIEKLPEEREENENEWKLSDIDILDLQQLENDQKNVIEKFKNWLSEYNNPLLIQWAGNDTQALDVSEIENLDARRLYRCYLEQLKMPARPHGTGTKLSDAVAHLFGPNMPFMAHRAFEDACLTAAVCIAIHNSGGEL